MFPTLRSKLVALTAAALVCGAGSALATDTDDVPPAGALTADAVTRQLQAAGYTNIHDVEFDDGHYEADATSTAGAAVDLDVDAMTGKVTHEEPDNH